MRLLGNAAIVLIGGGLLTFIMLNMVMGCTDWSQQECITPKEFFGLFWP